jgi:MoaA/NifB/PqqE/SkfB family radical SAM enzyme
MQFRAHPLDGALLYFDRTTGTHVLLESPAYARSTRRAPRVVQLGLTNRCNLRCSFCFRDRGLGSSWTAPEILAWGKALADEGVLELGFGQGEPLVFPEFPALVRRLARETPLAINFTTNGLRLDEARLDEFDGAFGQIRLSHYDDNDPLVRVGLLARRNARFGVNLLVTPERLVGLRATVESLVDAGCRDVLLLAYNGSDPELHLSPRLDRELARIILDLHARHGAALALRLSVCFGRPLFEVPQFPIQADCGAGDDFITIDSEKRILPCSFHANAIPVDSPNRALEVWRARRAHREHAGIEGCARARLRLADARPMAPPTPRVLVWQGFASNHSTSYTLVGEFSTAAKSAAYVAEIEALIERCQTLLGQDRSMPQNLWDALGREGAPPSSAWLYSPRTFVDWRPETVLAGGRRVYVHAQKTLHTFETFAHLLLRRHGRILWHHDRWGGSVPLAFGIEAGDAGESILKRLGRTRHECHVQGSRIYGIAEPYEVAHTAKLLRELPCAIACAPESDETLATALAERLALPPRKRRVEWMLFESLAIEHWKHSMDELRRDPSEALARIDWHHPFRMPDRLDAHPLLGGTIVRSEGAPFPAALQAWFGSRQMRLVMRPELRLRVGKRTGPDEPERPFQGLGAAHVAALSRPGGSFRVMPYRSSIDIVPRKPAATFAQLDAILGDESWLEVDIMAERPLADALARIDADLDAMR